MRLQRVLCQSKLDKLLLLHEFRVRAIVDDVASKHGRCERAVHLLGVDVLKFPVENEFVALEA